MAFDPSRLTLFAGLDERTLDAVTAALVERRLEGGEMLCEEGAPGDECWFIAEGSVTVSKVIDREDGREKVLATLGVGDFFGEMALLEEAPRSANVRAAGPATVFSLHRTAFRRLLDEASDAAARLLFGIIRTLVTRLRRTSTELVALFDTGKLAGSVADLPTLCAKILERLRESMGLERGLVLLVNPYSAALEVQEIYGYEAGLAGRLDLGTERGLLHHLIVKRSPFLFNRHRPPADGGHGFERPRMVGAPLVSGETVVGAIVLADPTGDAPLDMNHLNLLLGVSMQVATALENARRCEEERAKERHDRHFVTF